MRILLASQPKPVFGGSETYLLTIASELERLGHDVDVYAPAGGELARLARESGTRVAGEPSELPAGPELVVTQDGESCALMAERYPEAVRVYVLHATWYLPQLPPQVPDAYQAIVTMNDATRRRANALANPAEVVRLRQPVDLERFRDRGEPSPQLERVLLFGSHWVPGSRDHRIVAEACARLGLELGQVGGTAGLDPSPEFAIAGADAVIGVGRCVLEAMACKRAAYVFGNTAADGWVTTASYEALEAYGFAGGATGKVIDLDRLCTDLEQYTEDMGHANRHLVVPEHSARRHAGELVALARRLEPRPVADPAPLETVARLVRVQAEMTYRLGMAEGNNAWLRGENQRLAAEAESLRRQLARRRYRVGEALARPLDWLRRVARRRR